MNTRSARPNCGWFHALVFATVMASAGGAWSQSGAAQLSNQPGGDELASRLQVAAAAQQSGAPETIAEANKRVIALALYRMAELRLMEGMLPVSVELYKRSIGFENTADAHLGLALAYHRAGVVDAALQESGEVVKLDPNSAAAWNLQGKLWMMKQDYRQAAEALRKSFSLQKDMEVGYTLATALLNEKEKDKAAAVFKEMQGAIGDRAEMHILAGRAYEKADLAGDAEREYRNAIALDPKRSRGHYFLGLLYLEKNGWETTPQARQEFLAEVAQNPSDFFGNYFMGYITSGEKSYEESDRYLKIAAAAKPDWPEPYLYMGLNAYGLSYHKRAEELLRKAIELTGKDEARNNFQIRRAYFTLGRILILDGKREEGTRYIQRSREMETKLVVDGRKERALAANEALPGSGSSASAGNQASATPASVPAVANPAAAIDLAKLDAATMSDAEKQEAAAAEQQLRTVLGNAFNDLGTSEARRRQYGPALAYFLDAERWDPAAPGVMRNIGLAGFFTKNYAESSRALKIVVKENPQDRLAQSMLAISLYSIKNYPEAVKAFDVVGEAALTDPMMAYGWAVSLVQVNDRQRASTVLARLTALALTPEMFVLAGQVYDEMGDKANAEMCFKKAKEQNPAIQLPK